MQHPPHHPKRREVRVIGIGPGDPSLVTGQAAETIAELDVVVVIHKGEEVAELATLRHEVLRRHARPDHRVVVVEDPVRDGTLPYDEAVAKWHRARASCVAEVLQQHVSDGEVAGILVWGDPSLYDSTLRVLDMVHSLGHVSVEISVVSGVSSLHLLTARHRIPLNRVGRPVLITTGRQLRAGVPSGVHDLVVFLDGGGSFRTLIGRGYDIYWGAYLGSRDELLIAGPLDDVADEIHRVRAAARERKGWMFDVYLLRQQG